MKRTLLSVAVGLAMLGSMPFASVANGSVAPSPRAVKTGEPAFGGIREKIDPNLRGKTGIVKVIVELNDAPTVQVRADGASRGLSSTAVAAAQTRQLGLIEQKQQTLARSLSGLQASEIYRVQRVLNGVAIAVDAKNLAAIAQLPGVKAIHPLTTYERDNASSVPLIGAPQVWGGVGGGATGTGMRIGIIDSGIDYTHVGFDGTGNYAAAAANTAVIEPGTFPTLKVVGGTDLVGDAYDGSNTPQPDPDPLDCVYTEPTSGHGTHVAGTAAGVGVKADNTAYTGPYNNSIDFSTFKIGPGVAPQASLVAIRVFGCDGATDVVVEALDYAVDPNGDGNTADHLDVVNMSLGSDFGTESSADGIASDNAAAAGVLVVVSAGNSSDTNYISGSPGSAESVITVASTVDASDVVDAFRVNGGPLNGTHPARFSVAYDWDAALTPVTGDVVYPPTQRNGCSAFSIANAALLAGKIALLDWDDTPSCGSVKRAGNAVAAGAIGVIIADDSEVFDLSITGSAVVPSVSTPVEIGDAIKTQLAIPAAVNVTFDKTLRNSQVYSFAAGTDTLSSFSSRGPRRDGVLKPDIAAPGNGIFSVASGTNTEGHSLSGTSMAAPHIAGVMALLKQLHPTWSVQELKALAMNTATIDLRSSAAAISPVYGPSRVGAGRVDVPKAAVGGVLAFDKAEPMQVSVSFGTLEVTSTLSLSKQVTISNKSGAAATYALAYSPTSVIPGVTYTVSPQTVTVAAGGTADVTVALNADAAKMQHTADPTLALSQVGDTRHWLSEAQGYLVMFNGAGATLEMKANLNSGFEVPAAQSDVYAYADATLDLATSNLTYNITFSEVFTPTAGHIHVGAAGASGPVTAPIFAAAEPAVGLSSLAGNVVLDAAQVAELIKGNLYFNFHTPANPGGEIRGQIVPKNAALRLPIYASARPVSEMSATAAKLALASLTTATQETNIALAGRGLNTGSNTPLDILSLVSAFELQYTSPAIIDSNLITSNLDLQYVGVTSTMIPTGVVTESTVYFALSTYTNWSTPNEADLDIAIDTNEDGLADYLLYNSSPLDGTDSTDVFYVTLCDLTGMQAVCGPIDYINFVGADVFDTVPFNTNVLVMGVPAEAIGLSNTNTRFDYFAYTTDVRAGGVIDETPNLHFDVAAPGVRFNDGVDGLPVYPDLPNTAIPVSYSKANVFNNGTKGVLLIHHHNLSGKKAEVVALPSSLALPIIFRP